MQYFHDNKLESIQSDDASASNCVQQPELLVHSSDSHELNLWYDPVLIAHSELSISADSQQHLLEWKLNRWYPDLTKPHQGHR